MDVHSYKYDDTIHNGWQCPFCDRIEPLGSAADPHIQLSWYLNTILRHFAEDCCKLEWNATAKAELFLAQMRGFTTEQWAAYEQSRGGKHDHSRD